MEKENRKQKKNAGFSLVELIVVIAIIAVVGTAIVGFLNFCMRQYRNTRSEVNVQSKAQVVQNQIDNFMLNTNRAVYWDATDKKLWMIGQDENTNVFFAECVYLDTSDPDQNMYFQKYDCTKTADRNYEVSNAQTRQPLVDGVDSFEVTIPEAPGPDKGGKKKPQKAKLSLNVQLKLHHGAASSQRDYETTFDVTARNPIEKAVSITVN